MTNNKTVRVKKVSPYPIDGEILFEGKPPIKISIAKLAEIGLMARTRNIFHIGESYRCSFCLPLTENFFTETVRVVKTYDLLENFSSGLVEKSYTIEFHFTQMSPEKKKELLHFLEKIKQKQ